MERINDVISEDEPLLPQQRARKECIGARHVLSLMGFFGFANVYAMRVNLSVAIVAMVNSTAIPHINSSISDACQEQGGNSSAIIPDKTGEFVWDEKVQGIILGSFFWGYVLTQLPGGYLANRYGGKLLFGYGVLITSVLTLVTPVAARIGTPLLIAVRVLEGLGEGVTFPAMHAMLGRWSPPLERSKLASFTYSGSQFGTVISLPLSGLLCEYGFAGGWPSVFYVFGTLGVVWFGLWMILIHENPARHPRISFEERTLIETSLTGSVDLESKPDVPWRKIFTSIPVAMIVVAHFGQNWGFYTLLTELPSYLKNILRFDMKQNSIISATPYLFMWLVAMLASLLADFLRSRGILSTLATRRIFNSASFIGPAVALIGMSYSGCDFIVTIALLVFGVGINGASYSGFMSNHIDIAPNFAGTLLGLSNCVATIPGFMGPYVVGALTQGKQTIGQWRIVFFISAGCYLVSNTLFTLFAAGEEQSWNKVKKTSIMEDVGNADE